MNIREKLEKVCASCSKNTIQVYLTNIRRLYKFFDENGNDIPLTGKWLNTDTVIKKYKALPFNIRRHLSTAAVKYFQAIGKEDEDWSKNMFSDQKLYQENRLKNKVTVYEKNKMLKGGIKELKRITSELKRRINRDLRDDPHSLKSLYSYSMYISLRLFVELPFRNDFPTFQISGTKGNYIIWKNQTKAKFIITEYKNADKLGSREVEISKALTRALKQFIKFRADIVNHNFLLSNMKGNPLSKQAFSKAMHLITKKMSGKAFGSRILRVLHATDNAEIIEKSASLTNKLLHSSKQTLEYVKK